MDPLSGELLSTVRPQGIVDELRRLIAERVAGETELTAEFESQSSAAERQYAKAREEVLARYQKQRSESDAQYESLRKQIVDRFRAEQCEAEQENARRSGEAMVEAEQAELAARHRAQDAHWQATTVFEAGKVALDASKKAALDRFESLEQERLKLHEHAVAALVRWPQASVRPVAAARAASENPLDRFAAQLAEGVEVLKAVWGHANAGFWTRLNKRLRRGTGQDELDAASAMKTLLAEIQTTSQLTAAAIEADYQRQLAALAARLESDTQKAAHGLARETAEMKAHRDQSLAAAEERLAAVSSAARTRHNQARRELEERYNRLSAETETRHAEELGSLDRGYEDATADRRARYETRLAALAARWHAGIERLAAQSAQLNDECQRRFPPWDSQSPDSESWSAAEAIPRAIPFGRLELRLADMAGGIPSNPRMAPAASEFPIPAAFSFRQWPLLLWQAHGDGRARAVESISAVMLRLLVSMPPGKVKFLVVDPVGLGENFSAFMHLADFNEQLITSRIWTDAQHIDRRLAELTEHMENVIQVYLRNEFPTLDDYNASTGELAEPYRVLVVANFPSGFSESAARRLLSIVASGPRCGVYTLLSHDTSLPLPREFALADLERDALKLLWDGSQFRWNDPVLADLPLVLDAPPADAQVTSLVRQVGAAAQDAGRVQLPFQWIAPAEAQWWTADSSRGVDVPLGRAGVTKLQHLALGRGTSQHVLISGKTGSGKSTLLHVLIVNVAMRYSPDEVELYLVDFKKGVEFKAYAEARLPHARVVAIESEREFGLSVLERLDLELKHRGDLFRGRNVQDLEGFRHADPHTRMPRVLLIVDEFQELFVEDDRVSQTASLLLDRLVRQGRAFGIHVLLGSQTLAGAYSIPRATIGQMAVRIALQCSEADAHLILSEENTAARLLSRPGEAIYNDANGLYEGNHPFQIVWLADSERSDYLERLRRRADDSGRSYPMPLVFEGNVPANPASPGPLRDTIAAPAWDARRYAARAWLGTPVAIREPVAALFARQAGANLLLVGHQEESAFGILGNAVLGLAAQHGPDEMNGAPVSRFYVLDGSRPESPLAGGWERLAAVLPHGMRLVKTREAAAAIAEVADELARREAASGDDAPSIYLCVYDLARFRDLRKAEDDYGFSRDEGPPSPAKQFRAILHDGPALGIHVLAWGDSYSTTSRVLDRGAMADIEMRVLFRMSPADSSSLIDSPAAAQLGPYRAILADEGQGLADKFRPYGPPSAEWLAWVERQWAERQSLA